MTSYIMADKIEALLQREKQLNIQEKDLLAKHHELQEKSVHIRSLLLQYVKLLIAERDEMIKQLKFRDELAEITQTRTRSQTTSADSSLAPLTRTRRIQ